MSVVGNDTISLASAAHNCFDLTYYRFHTGDLGRMDKEGWVRITGRIKEQYKLENGKYVVPTPIETAISMSRFITQVVLCGANRPHNVALLVPEWPAIRAELKIDDSVSEEELAKVSTVRIKEIGDSLLYITSFYAFFSPLKTSPPIAGKRNF